MARKRIPRSPFGEWLARQREIRGWSLRDLASRAGISHSYLRTVELGYDPRSGSVVRPSVETLVDIASGLGVSPDELLSVYLNTQVYFGRSRHLKSSDNLSIPLYEAVVARDPELRHTEPKGLIAVESKEDQGPVRMLFGILAPDDSMAHGPRPIHKGDICIVRRGGVDDGHIGVFLVPGHPHAIIRRVKRDGRRLILTAADPSIQPQSYRQSQVQVIGEVVEVRFNPEA